MAIDTKAKRFSMMNMAGGAPVILPSLDPDSTIAAADRATLLNLYSGISLAAAIATISCTLVTRTGQALTSLTAISWAWFDQADPVDFVSPTDTGEVETTDGDGLIEISLPGSALTNGQTGSLVLRSDDGVKLGYYNLTVTV